MDGRSFPFSHTQRVAGNCPNQQQAARPHCTANHVSLVCNAPLVRAGCGGMCGTYWPPLMPHNHGSLGCAGGSQPIATSCRLPNLETASGNHRGHTTQPHPGPLPPFLLLLPMMLLLLFLPIVTQC